MCMGTDGYLLPGTQKCRDVSPRCPCKSNEHEPPVLVQGRYDLLGSLTHTVKGFTT